MAKAIQGKIFYQKDNAMAEVSNRAKIGFEDFQRHQKILKPRTIQLFKKFINQNKSGQKQLLDDQGDAYIEAFFEIVRALNSNRELMEYLLPTLDAIFVEESKLLREFIEQFKQKKNNSILSSLKSILSVDQHQPATYEAAARIVCIILGQLPIPVYEQEQKNFILELINMRKQRRKQKVSDFGLMSCLIHLNKHQAHIQTFMKNGGNELILDGLKNSGSDTQMLYYTLVNVWLLSFSSYAIQKFLSVPKFAVLKSVCEILQKLSREKLIRIAFFIFKNVQGSTPCLELLIDAKLLKTIDTLLKGNIKDEELIQYIKNMGIVLQDNMKILSSFDKYGRQIQSGNLQWSSVHTQRFWRDNALKFEQNEFHLIKKLRGMLTSKDHQNSAIACYDLGEFCRFYPRGKAIVESLQLKQLIMEKARYSEDKTVRQQALLALQKIMIQNWQNI